MKAGFEIADGETPTEVEAKALRERAASAVLKDATRRDVEGSMAASIMEQLWPPRKKSKQRQTVLLLFFARLDSGMHKC